MPDLISTPALLQGIFEFTEDAIVGENVDGIIILWNPAAERMFGYTAAEAIGRASTLIVPVDRREEAERVRAYARSGTPPEHFETIRLANGDRPLEVSLSISPIHDQDGRLVALSHILRDMTEHKRLERQALHLAALVQSSDDAIASKDLDGIVRTWNPAAERLFGYSAAEIVGQSIRRIIPSDRWHEEDEVLRRVRSGQRVEHFQTIRQRKNGTLVPISLTVSPIVDANGVIIGASKIARDITLQTTLEREKDRLGAIVDSSDDAIISKDLDGVIQTWNRAAERMFGYRASEAIGRSIALIIPDDRLPEEDEVLARIRNGGRIDHYETVRRHKDGTLVSISLTVSPIHDTAGRVIGASKTARDLSALRVYATTLEETVRERTSALQSANEQLEAFAYSVSHDLRAPLRGMHGLAHALLEDYGTVLDARAHEYARRIVLDASLLDRLIRDLLSYSRLTRIEVSIEAVEVGSIVDVVLHHLEDEIRTKGASVTVDPDLPRVKANRAVLTQVLTNLISNGIKFGGDHPTVRVRAERYGHSTRVWVEDEGIGIAPQHQARIFKAFERLHGNEEYPGTGIGLAIVQKGIERLGGRVGVESQLGAGSRFWFELPEAPAA